MKKDIILYIIRIIRGEIDDCQINQKKENL